MNTELEIIAFDAASCSIIEKAGADRIELCAGPAEGGTTPSHGMMETARRKTGIQLYPIIRPRGGDFLYDEDEFEIMLHDIRYAKNTGCDGVVAGILKADGTIDAKRCKIITEVAYPMGVTFHRAFDRVADFATSLEQVINCGFERILTSGGMPDALSGAHTIQKLIEQANGRIDIMPGSGIRGNNLEEIAKKTGATSFHSSARVMKPSAMIYTKKELQENLQSVSVSFDEIAAMRSVCNALA